MPTTVPAQPLLHMMERHNEIARRLVAGDKPSEIAVALDITPSRLSIIIASPIFQAHLRQLSAKADEIAVDLRVRMMQNADKAVTFMTDVLDNNTGKYEADLKFKVAKDQLDRSGFMPVQKSETVQTVLTSADIDNLKARRAKLVSTQTQEAT